MFEEAFEIYKKFGLKTKAIKVLLEQMEDLARAQEYATKVRAPLLHCRKFAPEASLQRPFASSRRLVMTCLFTNHDFLSAPCHGTSWH